MAEVFGSDDVDFAQYERETDAQQKVKPASVWMEELIERIKNPVRPKRTLMPWRKTHGLIAFRPGEVTLWGGANGNGKSLVTGQVALSLCAQAQRVCVASFEMKPMKTLERMARQYAGENPDHPAFRGNAEAIDLLVGAYGEFSAWSTDKLWLYDQQGTVTADQVCAVARYFAKEKQGQHFFIDSLMKCVSGEDDYNGQKSFVDQLTSIARDYSMHIHLVHHIRKPANEDHKPNKYDYKGSGSITDQVDNVISVWRNKAKERAREEGKEVDEAKNPDALLICDKQRNGEWEGNIGLWFHKDSQQFVGMANEEPIKLFLHPEDC